MSGTWSGMGAEVPQVELPHGAAIVVNLVVNYEEGSERSVQTGDREAEKELEKFRPPWSEVTATWLWSRCTSSALGSGSGD